MSIARIFATTAILLGPVSTVPIRPASTITSALLMQDSDKFSLYNSAQTAEDMIAARIGYDPTSGAFLMENNIHEEHATFGKADSSPLDSLRTLLANADAVVLGVHILKASRLTKDHYSVFSEYEISVKTVLEDKQHLGLSAGQDIVIARHGGSVPVGGSRVAAVDDHFPMFWMNEPYVFFLHFNKDSGSFGTGPQDVFLIHEGSVHNGRMRLLQGKVADQSNFLETLKKAIDIDKDGAQ